MNKIQILFLAMLIVCFAAPAAAQEQGVFEPLSIRVQGSVIGSADYKDSDASSTVAGGQVRINAGGFSLSYEGQHYSWDKVDQLSFGNGNDDPWNTLHRFTLGYSHNRHIDENWFYGVGITGTSAFEEEMGDSFGGAVRGHIGYIFNDNWKALIGARGFVNAIRFSAMPYIGVNYENLDKNGAGFFMNIGLPSNEIGYAFSETSKLRANFSIEGRTYRLKDDSSVAESGYVELSSMKTGLYYDWKPMKNLSLSLGPEYYFSRTTKMYDKHGDKFGGDNKQDGVFGGLLSIRYKF